MMAIEEGPDAMIPILVSIECLDNYNNELRPVLMHGDTQRRTSPKWMIGANFGLQLV